MKGAPTDVKKLFNTIDTLRIEQEALEQIVKEKNAALDNVHQRLSAADKTNEVLVNENRALKAQLIDIQAQNPEQHMPPAGQKDLLAAPQQRPHSQKTNLSDKHRQDNAKSRDMAVTFPRPIQLGHMLHHQDRRRPTPTLAQTDAIMGGSGLISTSLGSSTAPRSTTSHALGLRQASQHRFQGKSTDTDPAIMSYNQGRNPTTFRPTSITPSPISPCTGAAESRTLVPVSYSQPEHTDAHFREGFNSLFRSAERWARRFANIPCHQGNLTMPAPTRVLFSGVVDPSLAEALLGRVETRWTLVTRAIVQSLVGQIHGYSLLKAFSSETDGQVDACVNQLHPREYSFPCPCIALLSLLYHLSASRFLSYHTSLTVV